MTGRLFNARSLRALDWMNFFVANVQTGFGPFIASYLASHKWTQGEIGMALSVGTISAMVSQVPAGAAVDAMRNKKGAAAWAIVAIILSAVLLASSPTVLPVIAAEVFHGFASCMLVPAMAAISFALVGRQNLGDRLGRNARWASIGSAIAAGLMGLFGEYFSSRAVFWLTAALAMPALIALSMVQNTGTLDPVPQAKPEPDADEKRESLRELLRDKRMLIFAACIVLFHLSNAAMLNLAAGEVTAGMGDNVQLVIAACIIVPQAIVAMTSPSVGRKAQAWGRRPLLLVGFGALAIRGVMFATVHDPYLLVVVQVLDGITAAVFSVMIPLIVADVAFGSGHFNLAQGVVGTATGIGASLSTVLAGFASDVFGSSVAFLGLAAVAAVGLVVIWLAMPETRPQSQSVPP